MDTRTFADAVALLKSRSRKRSTAFVETGLKRVILPQGNLVARGKPAVLGMREWLQRLGYTEAKIDSLNIIHVAGTKGKGSTCAFIESFLRAHWQGTSFLGKTGLYTSPHLVSVNERIRINFQPLDKGLFTKYFFEVWDVLSTPNHDTDTGPGSLQLMALMSFHAFLQEGVKVAIYETHHGGEFCATNVIKHPIVTAITTIGMDHVIDLGPTLENIAWHKAGIIKNGVPAFTVTQDPSVLTVLQQRAAEKGAPLSVVEKSPDLPAGFPSEVQRLNCSLALETTNTFLQRVASIGPRRLSKQDIAIGIRQYQWPGRFQQIQTVDCTWYLDGAHNELSIVQAADWYQRASQRSASPTRRVLIFAQISHKRDGEAIVRQLAQSLKIPMHLVVFTTDHETQECCSEDEAVLIEKYSQVWQDMRSGDDKVCTAPSIDIAIGLAKSSPIPGLHTQVLVTGSLFLIGGVLKLGP